MEALLELEAVAGEPPGGRADEDLTGLRRVREPRGQVHGVADHRVLLAAARPEPAGHHRARLDADVQAEVEAAPAAEAAEGAAIP